MIRPYVVTASQEVQDWLTSPVDDAKRARQIREKFERARNLVQIAGPKTGDQILTKLRPGLFETRIDDWRLFSTIAGNEVVIVTFRIKKARRLSSRQLDSIEAQIARYMATREARR